MTVRGSAGRSASVQPTRSERRCAALYRLRIVLLLVAVALGAVGAGVAVALVFAAGRVTAGAPDTTEGTLRVRAELHTGVEQVLIGVVSALALARSAEGAQYGRLYLEQLGDTSLLVGSRSEIGRGFRAAITVERRRSTTHLAYAILRLPGDDSIQSAVLQFELHLIGAVRRVDPNADVRLVGRALRDLDRLGFTAPEEQEG